MVHLEKLLKHFCERINLTSLFVHNSAWIHPIKLSTEVHLLNCIQNTADSVQLLFRIFNSLLSRKSLEHTQNEKQKDHWSIINLKTK